MSDSKKVRIWAENGTKEEPTTKYSQGWLGGEKPPAEYANWLQNLFSLKVNYILRRAFPDWQNDTSYKANDWIQHSGSVWHAKRDNVAVEPKPENSADWETLQSFLSLGALAYKSKASLVSDITGILGVKNGGTGSSTAAGARTNLSVYSKAETSQIIGQYVPLAGTENITGDLLSRKSSNMKIGMAANGSPHLLFSQNNNKSTLYVRGSSDATFGGRIAIQPSASSTNETVFERSGIVSMPLPRKTDANQDNTDAALTVKAYVNSEDTKVRNVANSKIPLSGSSAITGNLLITGTTTTSHYVGRASSSSPRIGFTRNDTAGSLLLGAGNSSSSGIVHVRPRGVTSNSNETQFKPDGTVVMPHPKTARAPTSSQDLANKAYVDTKAPGTHNHSAANITSGVLSQARIPAARNSASAGGGFGGFRYKLTGNRLDLYTT